MAGLPSYEEATTRQDWLELVAPYVRFADYRALSLVNGRYRDVFAPLLWRNLFKAARLAGLDPSDDIDWWFDFVFDKLGAVRPTARALVRVLDATDFAKDSYQFASDQTDRSLQQSFARALRLLPAVNSLLIDGHPELDLGFLVDATSTAEQHPLLVLSCADCPSHVSSTFFRSSTLQELVYLDISGMPGSIRSLHEPGVLPNLRCLKLRSRELDDSTISVTVNRFRLRLWSLDVSGNRISDAAAQEIRDKCFSKADLRSSVYFYTEGKLLIESGGDEAYGPFMSIQESKWSRTFTHPERFFVDSPFYLADEEARLQEYEVLRPSGHEHVRKDTAEYAVEALAAHDSHLASSAIRSSKGLTHLNISRTMISSAGLERLVRTSNGHLEHLACDSIPLVAPWITSKVWPEMSTLHGTAGTADVFRPVCSSSLRSLRIHHSLVTEVLNLELVGMSSLSCIYLSEQAVLPRSRQLYRGTFIPDMNPRLTSLVLTNIPRRSSGPIIEKLLSFLRLLSEQEQAILETAEAFGSSRRGPDLLRGLRHVRLEFETDPMEEGFSTAEDLDAEELMNSGDQGFSFFEGEQYEKAPAEVRQRSELGRTSDSSRGFDDATTIVSDRVEKEAEVGEFTEHRCYWNEEFFSIKVWLGPERPDPQSALAQYRRLVMVHNIRTCVGPASPAQLRACAPEGSYIFHTAWALAVMPLELKAPPKRELAVMRDVLDELKKYRLTGRAKLAQLKRAHGSAPLGAPHYFWTGRLEVSTEAPMPHQSAAKYWR